MYDLGDYNIIRYKCPECGYICDSGDIDFCDWTCPECSFIHQDKDAWIQVNHNFKELKHSG
jgi:rubredoxin